MVTWSATRLQRWITLDCLLVRRVMQRCYRRSTIHIHTLADDDKRIRAYWHSNCSQCHRPGHFIQNVDIDFQFDTDWIDMNICNHAPGAGNLGVSGAQRLTPGSAAESLVYLRTDRRNTDAMPPLGSTLVDDYF